MAEEEFQEQSSVKTETEKEQSAVEKKKAKECFDFVVKTAGKHYLLGEQVNNETLKPNWVIGLGWSHAMFVIVLEKLYGKEN